jgi:hypothetical protein
MHEQLSGYSPHPIASWWLPYQRLYKSWAKMTTSNYQEALKPQNYNQQGLVHFARMTSSLSTINYILSVWIFLKCLSLAQWWCTHSYLTRYYLTMAGTTLLIQNTRAGAKSTQSKFSQSDLWSKHLTKQTYLFLPIHLLPIWRLLWIEILHLPKIHILKP